MSPNLRVKFLLGYSVYITIGQGIFSLCERHQPISIILIKYKQNITHTISNVQYNIKFIKYVDCLQQLVGVS